jgi:hypothetical protein
MVSVVLGDVDPDHFGQYSCQFLGPLSLHKVPSSGQRAAELHYSSRLVLVSGSARISLSRWSLAINRSLGFTPGVAQLRVFSAASLAKDSSVSGKGNVIVCPY